MQFDLVTTNHAHPAMPQLAFNDRISTGVAPGGTLLIVAHLHRLDGTRTPRAAPARRGIRHPHRHHRGPGQHPLEDQHRPRAHPHAHRARGPGSSSARRRRSHHTTPLTAPLRQRQGFLLRRRCLMPKPARGSNVGESSESRATPGAHSVEIANAGHMVAGDENEVFAAAVGRFVDGLALCHASNA